MTSVSVVTGAWGDYGGFLPDWAESIVAQSVPVDQVVIVDAGVDDRSELLRAARILRDAGLTVTATRPRSHGGMGATMNAAVSRATSEFVIRLDADDMLLPHAVADVHRLAGDADVVVFGARRGERVHLFENTSSEWILAGRQGSMSPSAFRRSMWQASPFIEANDWIESAFWVGLAHQGARFVPTGSVGFTYRQHDGSHSSTISPADKAAARRQHLDLCRDWSPPA